MIKKILQMFNKKENKTTSDIAKNRLQLVLTHDRFKLSSEKLKRLENDLLKVLSNYLEIDEDKLEVELKNQGRKTTLSANAPVREIKR